MTEPLLVDLGNSRLKWATAKGGTLVESRAREWRGADFMGLLDACWSNLEPPRAVVASVVAAAEPKARLVEWVHARWGVPLHLLAARERQAGITCGYRDPGQLGVDRWMAMVAAHTRYPQGSLVLDCGTATTLDALAGGRHLGGYILPGVAAMRDLLLRQTAIEVRGSPAVAAEWGRSTAACIELGTVKAVVTLVEHSLERLQAAGVCDPALVVTGGQAGVILPHMQVDYRRHDDLVLEGVMHCAEELVT